MKKISIQGILAFCCLSLLCACSGYLDVYTENTIPTEKYWSSKEDVENVLYDGYYTLRNSVESYLIPLGEYRAGCVYNTKGSALQQFNITTGTSTCKWSVFYQIIHDANLVLANAQSVRGSDDSYTEGEANSHLCEAYWLRALAYFYLVRNWGEVPIVTAPYETDRDNYYVAKSSENEVLAQIKSDLDAAIALGAAKESFDTNWQTKGRATIWAIYALKADVCLWNHDYDEAINAADAILKSQSAAAPRFMSTANHSSWFSMFNPGNAEESIFELQWNKESSDGTLQQINNLPSLFYGLNDKNGNASVRMLQYSETMADAFASEYREILRYYSEDEYAVRTQYGGCGQIDQEPNVVWKYVGGSTILETRTNDELDPNFIIYRVAEIMLIKAEALLMRNGGESLEDNREALELVNAIRSRTNLRDASAEETSLEDIIKAIYNERIMELAGEGKAWYDFLRLGRYGTVGGTDFRSMMTDYVIDYNKQASESTIRNTLGDKNKWYLPISDSEISVNPLLVQNPSY